MSEPEDRNDTRDPLNPDADDPRSTADRLLAPLFEDTTLWGLLAVMALVLGTFLASILLMALERRPFAIAALLGVAWISVDLFRRSRRPGEPMGAAGRLIIGLWVVSAGIAVLARFAGLF